MRNLKVTRDGQRFSVLLDDRAREIRVSTDLVDVLAEIRDTNHRFHHRLMREPAIGRIVTERGATAAELATAVNKLEEVWLRHRTGV